MAKRVPTRQLDHDNWDQEEEKEEPGTFAVASDQELKGRVMKKARRTLSTSDTPGDGTPSPFKAFSGFSNKSPFQTPNFSALVQNARTNQETSLTQDENKPSFPTPNFNFLSDNAKTGSDMNSQQIINSSRNGFSESAEGVKGVSSEVTETQSSEKSNSSDATQSSVSGFKDQDIQYFKMLRNLNESVLKWIQMHFAKNPCCNFCPVFNDYKNYVHQLEIKYLNKGTSNTSSNSGNNSAFKMPENMAWMRTSQSKSDFFKSDSPSKSQSPPLDQKSDSEMKYGAGFPSNTTNTSTFSFGIKNYPTATSGSKPEASTPKTTEKSDIDAAKDSESTPKVQPFSFGHVTKSSTDGSASVDKSLFPNPEKKLFTFEYNSSAPALKPAGDSETADNAENEDYVPPKNEVEPIAEEGAVYTKRCKLFYKKNNEYTDKGVGTLYLKPADGKTQLLIRADTALGNVLLNIMLSAALPMQRTGKNNVLIVCIPNPPLDTDKNSEGDAKKAVPLLIRVKTSEDADELLAMLNKYKV